MLASVCKILLMIMGPMFKFLAARAPDKVIEIMKEVAPVMDAFKEAVDAEVAKREAMKSAR